MKRLNENYSPKLPWPIWGLLILVALLAFTALVYFVYGIRGISLLANANALGSQGDFIGGHLASIIGSITLIVVILTGYLQIQQDRRFRLRELYLNGISAISSYEEQKPGAEQAMRILDYLALVAFQLKDDELFLILNTVITKEIESNLDGIEKAKGREYPNAILARHKIAEILEAHYKANRKTKGKPTA